MTLADTINSIGVFLILLAFFLLSFRFLTSNSKIYLFLNLSGSGLACYGSILIHSIPFTILEGTWALVSFITIFRSFLK